MITQEIGTSTASEFRVKGPNNRLNGVLSELRPNRSFEELDGNDRIGACLLRNEHYYKGNVTTTKEYKLSLNSDDLMDAFDKEARFFLLRGYHQRPIPYLVLRAVNRTSLEVLPSELSLYKREELIKLCKKGICEDENKLVNSTLSPSSKSRLQELLRKYDGSKKIYEIGGLCGSDKSKLGTIGLIYLIARTAYQEKWDLEIQSCHPRHLGVYLASGLPYRTINEVVENKITPEPYLDYLGRPAVTLYLDGEELRERFPSLEKKLMGK